MIANKDIPVPLRIISGEITQCRIVPSCFIQVKGPVPASGVIRTGSGIVHGPHPVGDIPVTTGIVVQGPVSDSCVVISGCI